MLLLATLDRSLDTTGDALARGRVHDLAAQAVDGTLPDTLATIDGEGVGQVFGTRRTGAGRVAQHHRAQADHRCSAAVVPAGAAGSCAMHPTTTRPRTTACGCRRSRWRDGHVTVLAGTSLESVGEASRTLRRDLAVGVPVLLLLLASGTWFVVGQDAAPGRGHP